MPYGTTFPPQKRWDNKAPVNIGFKKLLYIKHGLLSHRLRGEGGGEATKGGALFPRPPGRLYGFYKLAAKPPTTTLTAEGRVKLKPL